MPLEQSSGRFLNPAFGELVVDPEAMAVRLAGVMSGTLEHWQGDIYRVTWIGPWSLTHFLEVEGGAVHLRGFGRFVRQQD